MKLFSKKSIVSNKPKGMLEHVKVSVDTESDCKGFSIVEPLYPPPFGLCGNYHNKGIVPHHDVAYPYTPVSLEDLG